MGIVSLSLYTTAKGAGHVLPVIFWNARENIFLATCTGRACTMTLPWTAQILISVVAFVSGMLCLVKAGQNYGSASLIGAPANLVMAFVSSLIALGLLAASGTRREQLYRIVTSGPDVALWTLGFAVLFFVGNMFFFDGLVSAPNAGFARALMTVEVGALAVMSWLLFGAPLPLSKVAGIVLVVIGAVLVSIT